MSLPRQIREISRALVLTAAEQDMVARVIGDLKRVNAAFRHAPDIAIALQDLSVSLQDRQKALHGALQEDTHEFVVNALLMLQEAGLLDRLEIFTQTVVNAAATILGHHDAIIYSAVKLEDDEKTKIKKALQQKFGQDLGFEERLEPSILGGLVVEVGDWRFDDSLKQHVKELEEQLAA